MLNRAIATLGILLLACGAAAAQGLVIPNEPDVPPLALTGHTVRVEIDRQASTTTVEQVFHNHTDRPLEAQYVFPVPKGAVVSRFTMLVDGKEKAGEVVEKTKARQIYNSIVSRSQDPGLLEWLGNDIFRANIFPIAPRGDQRITVKFDQVLAADAGLVSYVYPVRAAGKRAPTVHGEFKLEVTVKAGAPLRNVYSPSHPVNIVRPNDQEARVTLERRHALLDRDFQLYYGVSDKEVGLNLVTFRPDAAQPGYFMMLVSPTSQATTARIVERDLVFVIDVSGSMAGEKIKQARAALRHCVQSLNDGDRFDIVKFSSAIESWKREFVSAKDFRKAGMEYSDTLLTEGGTNIDGALQAAFAYPRHASRPFFVVFMTDGKPTVGDTDPTRIVDRVRKARAAERGEQIRLFTWGVGYDLDTQLVDGMASVGGGVSEYVRPEEDIEAKVSAFFNKASRPVLTNLDLAPIGDKVQLVNVYPKPLPDLYAGGQMVVFGRYTGSGDVALQLKGRVNDKAENFTYEGTFPAAEAKNKFVEPLWAQRRIGNLLEHIRLNGESKEIVDDVIRLSVEYGIQTPYTSYLVLEDGRPQALHRANRVPAATTGGERKGGAGAAGKPALGAPAPAPPAAEPALRDLASKAAPQDPARQEAEKSKGSKEEDRARREFADALSSGFDKKDGKAAVDTAEYLKRLKQSERQDEAGGKVAAFKRAGKTRFYEYRGMWVDERFEASCKVTMVKFGGAAYFRLIELKPDLVEVFKVGDALVYVTAAGQALGVGASGEETLTDAQIEDLFKAAAK
jgi:Ca-activated chloride channel family protein